MPDASIGLVCCIHALSSGWLQRLCARLAENALVTIPTMAILIMCTEPGHRRYAQVATFRPLQPLGEGLHFMSERGIYPAQARRCAGLPTLLIAVNLSRCIAQRRSPAASAPGACRPMNVLSPQLAVPTQGASARQRYERCLFRHVPPTLFYHVVPVAEVEARWNSLGCRRSTFFNFGVCGST